jgi:hypothetical protein
MLRARGPALGEGTRQDHQSDAESGDGQRGSGGHPDRPGPPSGANAGFQPVSVPVLIGGVLLTVTHHPCQLLLEVVHGSFFTPPARRPQPEAAATVRRRVP